MASRERDNTTNDIFGLNASVEKNYLIASDRIFDTNPIRCTKVKRSTFDDSEKG